MGCCVASKLNIVRGKTLKIIIFITTKSLHKIKINFYAASASTHLSFCIPFKVNGGVSYKQKFIHLQCGDIKTPRMSKNNTHSHIKKTKQRTAVCTDKVVIDNQNPFVILKSV